jgi:hypothetical protein
MCSGILVRATTQRAGKEKKQCTKENSVHLSFVFANTRITEHPKALKMFAKGLQMRCEAHA